jgi:uncharacterized membrane protein YadS
MALFLLPTNFSLVRGAMTSACLAAVLCARGLKINVEDFAHNGRPLLAFERVRLWLTGTVSGKQEAYE